MLPALGLAAWLPGLEAELIGPFRLAAYGQAYLLFGLPNVFVATAVLFALAALSRRMLAGYLGGALLGLATLASTIVAEATGNWALATLLDPFAFLYLRARSQSWTPSQKSTQLIGLDAELLTNRLLWLGLALAALAATYWRFRLVHHAAGNAWYPRGASAMRRPTNDPLEQPWSAPWPVPAVVREFGWATRLRQLLAVAGHSFRTLLTSRSALLLPTLVLVLLLIGGELLEGELGTPSRPTTARVADLYNQFAVGLLGALLITLGTGQLVWQERAARLHDITDAAPVPTGVLLLGKYLGLSLLLLTLQATLLTAGVLLQLLLGHQQLELGLHLQLLFGFQLVDLLLLAALALAVHVLVNQPYVGHLVVLLAYLFTTYAGALGVEHKLLVYGAAPAWSYSDLSGFGSSVLPWAWFKGYWAAWALLLGLLAVRCWVRGRPEGQRLRRAGRGLSRHMAVAGTGAAGLVLVLGGFIFYNTNVLNPYETAAGQLEARAEYERRYGRYEGRPQPLVTATRLRVALYPARQASEISGTYTLVNRSARPIDSVHVVTNPAVATDSVRFSQPARQVLADPRLGYRLYALQRPLPAGDSLQLHFRVRSAPRGFTNDGIASAVVANGTYLEHLGDEQPQGRRWLPLVGYQPSRALPNAGTRRQYGLPPQPLVRSLYDTAARHDPAGRERIRFEAVISTTGDQVAIAPGVLRRVWKARGRRYFHYATTAPIRNFYPLFSAAYAVREARWGGVRIQVWYRPGHAGNVARMLRSAQASLAYYSRQFGPYPYPQLRFVERPGTSTSLRAYLGIIAYSEGFAALHPEADARQIDLPFAVVAHEVAHQWWGHQLIPAQVEGAPLLTESLA